ncbi:MAG: protein kinase [Planctomycetales bacterium]
MQPPYEEIRNCFADLTRLDPRSREAELERLRDEDPPMGNAVTELFKHDAAAEDAKFLDFDDEAENLWDQGESAPDPREPSILERVGGYEIVKIIGEGGMGVVYKAWDPKTKRHVALKFEKQPSSHNDVPVEIEAISRLDHSNIVPIYSASTYQGEPYFVMKFIEGRSLKDELETKPLSSRDAARLVRTLAEAVAYAHGRNVIHRDLKPANVLVDVNGTPYLADFGIAKLSDAEDLVSQPEEVRGTLPYMAPEQLSGTHSVSVRTDVYGLGAILYACLTGRPPFQDEINQLIHQVKHQPPMPPGKVRSGVAPDLEAICLQCLKKDSGDRYGTADALAEDLIRYLDDDTPWAAKETTFSFLLKLFNRRPPLNNIQAIGGAVWGGIITFIFHAAVFFLIAFQWHVAWLWGVFAGGMAALIAVNLCYYWLRYWQLNAAERGAGTINCGVNIALVLLIVLRGPLTWDEPITRFWDVYPAAALIVGTTFFAYAAVSSGRFLLFGIMWFLLAATCDLFPYWSPLQFAAAGAITAVAGIWEVKQCVKQSG